MTTAVGEQGWEPSPGPPLDHRWPGEVWRAGPHLVWHGPASEVEALVARTTWLAAALPGDPGLATAPAVVEDGWVVLAGVDGEPGHRPERQPAPAEVPAAIGRALRRLHDLEPIGDARPGGPFDRSWDRVVAEVERAAAEGVIEAEVLPDPYRRYTVDRLVELVAEAEPLVDDAVVTHGAPVAPNLFLADGGVTALVGLHRLGPADRHLDLAVAHHSLHRLFGPESVIGFYDGYGRQPDLVRLDTCILVDLLLDRSLVEIER